jgi:hypothetical protein
VARTHAVTPGGVWDVFGALYAPGFWGGVGGWGIKRGPVDRLVCHAPVESHHTLHSGIVVLRPRDDRGVALRVVHTRVRVFVFPRGEVNAVPVELFSGSEVQANDFKPLRDPGSGTSGVGDFRVGDFRTVMTNG